jgi:teichoic acid transport system ATP-binding protein
MAGSEPAPVTLSVEAAHVVYRPDLDRTNSLRDLVLGRRGPRSSEIHAVNGVSLEMRAGDLLGVIGSNGSGKSSLMRAIAGLIPLESGRIRARSIPTLLGVGAVLQPRLSGRRNIMIGGLALGLSKATVEEKFDEIVDFAGLREFIDLPMRAYSSGMRARLLFSISTVVQPDLLLVDEALAVGDAAFKRRSQNRLQDMAEHAGTVIMVSHRLRIIRETCSRVIWLDKGTIRMDGDPDPVVDDYEQFAESQDGPGTGP